MDFNRTYNAATDDPMNVSRARRENPITAPGVVGGLATGLNSLGFKNTAAAIQGSAEDTQRAYQQGGMSQGVGMAARTMITPAMGVAHDLWNSATAIPGFGRMLDPAAEALRTAVTGEVVQKPAAKPTAPAPTVPQRPTFGAGGSNPNYGNEGRVTNATPQAGLQTYKRGDTITTANVGNAPVNSYDGAANNESMARANAIRQGLIDRQPRGGSAALPDQNAAWNARMERNRQMEDITTLMARNPQVAQGIAAAFKAQSDEAAYNGRSNAVVAAEGLRGRNQLAAEGMRGKNQLEATGMQGQAQLAAENQRGINAQLLEQLRQSSPELATEMARNLADAGLKQRQTEVLSARPKMDPTKMFEAMMANGGDPTAAFTLAQAAAQGVDLNALMNEFQSNQAVKRAQGGIIPDPDHLAAQESVQQGRGLDVSGRMVTGAGTSKSDSLPAVIDGEHPAELSKDEFVMPVEVVKYFGLNHLNRMIEKARKGLASAPA